MSDYIIDITILSILLGFAVMGFISGFTGKVLSLLSWATSLVAATTLFPLCAPYLAPYISTPLIANIVAFAGVFIISLILLIWISKTISGSVKKSKIGTIDRNLGMLFGVVLGAFFLSVVALGMRFFVPQNPQPETLQKSRLFPWVELLAGHVSHFLPTNLALPNALFNASDALDQRIKEEAAMKLATLKPKAKEATPGRQGHTPAPPATTSKKAGPEKRGYHKKDRQEISSLFAAVGDE